LRKRPELEILKEGPRKCFGSEFHVGGPATANAWPQCVIKRDYSCLVKYWESGETAASGRVVKRECVGDIVLSDDCQAAVRVHTIMHAAIYSIWHGSAHWSSDHSCPHLSRVSAKHWLVTVADVRTVTSFSLSWPDGGCQDFLCRNNFIHVTSFSWWAVLLMWPLGLWLLIFFLTVIFSWGCIWWTFTNILLFWS